MLLVETNGVYSDTARLCKLLDHAASDAVGALWDMHHPYRFANEKPGKTVQNLGAYIKYVHTKDSIVDNGAIKYRMMGGRIRKNNDRSHRYLPETYILK